MSHKISTPSPKSAIGPDPIQMQLLQHNLHLDTIKTFVTVLDKSIPDSPLHQLATQLLLTSLQPFLPPTLNDQDKTANDVA